MKIKKTVLKKRKVKVEKFKQKGYKMFNNDIIKNLQEIIANLPDEQELLLSTLRAITTKRKNEK